MKKFALEIDITKINISEGKITIELSPDECENINNYIENNGIRYQYYDLDGLMSEYHKSLIDDKLMSNIIYNVKLKQL